mgnify:CR=1 FL=1
MKNKIFHKSGTHITYSIQSGKSPYVVFLHGLMSDMKGTKALAIEEHLKKIGNGYIRFDCRGHGESGGEFPNFGINDWAEDATLILTELTNNPVVLIGSSMGGWSMLLTAINHPEKVLGLIGIAAAPDFTEDLIAQTLTDEQQQQMAQNGYLDIPNCYGDEPYRIRQELIDEGKNNLLLRGNININVPVRLIHGMQDEDVPWKTGLSITDKLMSSDVEITYVKAGDHRLSEQNDLKRLERAIMALLQDLG